MVECGSSARRRFSFADLGVNIKILTTVGIAGLVAFIVGFTGLRSLSQSSAAAQKIYSSNVASVGAVGDIRAAMVQTSDGTGHIPDAHCVLDSRHRVFTEHDIAALTEDARHSMEILAEYRIG